MIEQFNFDIQLIFAILNGKVSAAINRKLSRNFRQNGMDITPEQWTVLLFLWEKDGVTQQELCNATFKDKPSMTRLIDNMEREDFRQERPPHQPDSPDPYRKRTGREGSVHCQQNPQGSLTRTDIGRIACQSGSFTQNIHKYQRLKKKLLYKCLLFD